MKLLFRFVILAATFAVCTSSRSFASPLKHSEDHYFCDYDMILPDYAVQYCAGLASGKTVNSYIATLVDNTIEAVHRNCTQHYENLCDGLPELQKNQKSGAHAHCKEDVEDAICEYPMTHEHGLGKKVYRIYLKSVFDMIILFETKKKELLRGQESEMCTLFQQNKQLINLIKAQKCKTITNILTKTTCNKIMRRI